MLCACYGKLFFFYTIGSCASYCIKTHSGMRTARIRKMAAKAATLRRESLASQTLYSIKSKEKKHESYWKKGYS